MPNTHKVLGSSPSKITCFFEPDLEFLVPFTTSIDHLSLFFYRFLGTFISPHIPMPYNVVALVSGGKDSCFALHECIRYGEGWSVLEGGLEMVVDEGPCRTQLGGGG